MLGSTFDELEDLEPKTIGIENVMLLFFHVYPLMSHCRMLAKMLSPR